MRFFTVACNHRSWIRLVYNRIEHILDSKVLTGFLFSYDFMTIVFSGFNLVHITKSRELYLISESNQKL